MAETKQPASQWTFGRGRGFRPSQPFKPARRPGQPSTPDKMPPSSANDRLADIETGVGKCRIDSIANQSKGDSLAQPNASAGSGSNCSDPSIQGPGGGGTNGKASPAPTAASLKGGVTQLKAKYSYKANPESPLGQKELGIQQGEGVVFVETCQENEMWWKVRREDSREEGFVPASYLEVRSDKVTQLPWLAANQTREDAQLPKAKPEWKPYVSAYNREGNVKEGGSSANQDQYYCKWCDKQLNGPKPYGAHMTSKAHKEEVEYAKEKGEYTED